MKQIFPYSIIIIIVALFASVSVSAQSAKPKKSKPLMPKKINLAEQLKYFENNIDSACYLVSLCADMPSDEDPMRVAYYQEPGHVFLILQKINETRVGDTTNLVFGFYPAKGLPLIFKRRMRSRIKDNSKRVYDVKITRAVSSEDFKLLGKKALVLSNQDYHLNRYNCYDFAVEVFNSILPADTIPIQRIKFPFPFGSGGSPVSLYTYLKSMDYIKQSWSYTVNIGGLIAPKSKGRISN